MHRWRMTYPLTEWFGVGKFKVLAMRFILVMGLILTSVLQIAAQQVFRPECFLIHYLKYKHLLIRCLGCLGI